MMKKPEGSEGENPLPISSNVRSAARGEAVVEVILNAALEELADVGYSGLRIDEVAARAQVNKTTIYRRFADKGELVKAVFESSKARSLVPSAPPDTGNLRDDLLETCRRIGNTSRTTCGRAFMRTFLFDGARAELASILAEFRKIRQTVGPEFAILRAIARGEVPSTIDPVATAEVLAAAIHFKTYRPDSTLPDEAYYQWLVDSVLYGVTRSPIDGAASTGASHRQAT